MASSVVLRHSLAAAAKRPLIIPLQLGTSSSAFALNPPHSSSFLTDAHTSFKCTHTHHDSPPFNIQLCLRSRWPYVSSPLSPNSLNLPSKHTRLLTLRSGALTDGFGLAIYKGTVNDPTTFPPAKKSVGSHHWTFERLLSASLVPLTAAAFATSGSPTPLLDGLLGISLIVHSHIGVRFPPPPSSPSSSSTGAYAYPPCLALVVGKSLSSTPYWWIMFTSASFPPSARFSLGRCA